MSVNDIIKKSFLAEFDSGIDYASILPAVAAALILGLIIAFIYSRFFGGVIYSRGYAQTLIGMSVLTCMVTLAISSNVVISLGMVGSLSIIRYRTAVKSPLDLLYMFWSVTVGITVGAHMYGLALITSAAMFLVVLAFQFRKDFGSLYVCVIHFTGDTAEDEICRRFGRTRYHVKSKTMYTGRTELALEVFCNKHKLQQFETLRDILGVEDVTFIQYNGEYHG